MVVVKYCYRQETNKRMYYEILRQIKRLAE